MLSRKDKPSLNIKRDCRIVSSCALQPPPTFLKVFSQQETSRTNFSVSTLSVRSREVSPLSIPLPHENSLLSTPTASVRSIHKLGSNKKHRTIPEEFQIRQPLTDVVPLTQLSFATETLPYNYRNSERRLLFEMDDEVNEWACCMGLRNK